MAMDRPRIGERTGETAGREAWQPMAVPRPSGAGYQPSPRELALQAELGRRTPSEVARMMVANPGMDYRAVVQDIQSLQRAAYPYREGAGVAGINATGPAHQLDFQLAQRERQVRERDSRTPAEREAAIARHADEIRQTVNYAGDGPVELTAALEPEIQLEARFRDLSGVEGEIAAERNHARVLAQAQTAAQAEDALRSQAAAYREYLARIESGATTSGSGSARDDTKDALRAATPPPTTKQSASGSYSPSPSLDRLRAQRMELWSNPDRRGQSR